MKSARSTPTNVDDYIAGFPKNVQQLLQSVRGAIRASVPEASEKISYGIPTFTLGRNLIHFAAFRNHIGLYPGTAAIKTFEEELKGFPTAKGTVRFPLNEALPLPLSAKIVRFCVAEKSRRVKNKRNPNEPRSRRVQRGV